MSDIENKVDSIVNGSKSQIDRGKIKEESFKNLMCFLNGYILRSASKNELKNKIEQLLYKKIEEEGEDLPYGVLIKLLEVLTKNEVEAATPILKIIENATKQSDSPIDSKDDVEKDETSNITSDEYKKVKKFLSVIDELEKSEF